MTTRLTSVRNIPAEVKQALVDDAQAAGRSVADLAADLLAQFLSVPYTPSGRATGPKAGVTDQLQLRMPQNLATALWATAREWQLTQSRAAIRIWAAHYGVPFRPGSGT